MDESHKLSAEWQDTEWFNLYKRQEREANLYCLEFAYMSGETIHTQKDKRILIIKVSMEVTCKKKGQSCR